MSKPVIVQSDNTLLVEVNNPKFELARDSISPFAELEKSPEHIHTYRITPLSLWNAAASGLKLSEQGYTINILEKQKAVGGLSASIPINGFKIDIGPHYMTLKKDSEITDEIFDIVGKENIRIIKGEYRNIIFHAFQNGGAEWLRNNVYSKISK